MHLDIATWVQFGLTYDLFRLSSALLYAIFAMGILNLGLLHYDGVTRGTGHVNQFPEGYFVMLAAQLLPTALTGAIIGDSFVFGTRIVTLVAVLVVYTLATSPQGLNTTRNRVWGFGWLTLGMPVPLVWSTNDDLRALVATYESLISYAVIGIMLAFVVKGQFSVAKALFRHFVAGNYTVKRFNLQVVRFFAFETQAVHYWFIPSTATLVFGYDPFFVQGVMGAGGTFIVLLGALWGWLRGSNARAQKRLALAT